MPHLYSSDRHSCHHHSNSRFCVCLVCLSASVRRVKSIGATGKLGKGGPAAAVAKARRPAGVSSDHQTDNMDKKKRVKQPKQLSDDQKKDIHHAFHLLDENHDGKINAGELKKMMEKLGLAATDYHVLYFLKKLGKEGDGLISEEEFFVFMNEFSDEDNVMEELLAAFKVFDKDGNGFITKEELKRAMEMIGENLTDKALDELLKSADINRDGKIDYSEFAKMLL